MKALESFQEDRVKKIIDQVESEFREVYTDSITSTVAILPKDELAIMASTFVNLTSFMRRVSRDLESVGGPVDVAVISKKDGFIWISRKHYFDIRFNPHFNSRYASPLEDQHV